MTKYNKFPSPKKKIIKIKNIKIFEQPVLKKKNFKTRLVKLFFLQTLTKN